MPAPVASRRRKGDHAIPASGAHEAVIATIIESVTDDACAGQEQVERRMRPAMPNGRGGNH